VNPAEETENPAAITAAIDEFNKLVANEIAEAKSSLGKA